MHLVGPHLTTTGKRRGKKKYRNADEARRERELEASWNSLKDRWGVSDKQQKQKPKKTTLTVANNTLGSRDTGPRHPSLFNWGAGPLTTKQTPKYTGTKLIGIGTLHKSNAIPIFSDEEAVDIAKMRR
jgi:hypothetical protein